MGEKNINLTKVTFDLATISSEKENLDVRVYGGGTGLRINPQVPNRERFRTL